MPDTAATTSTRVQGGRSQRWLARLSFVFATLAIVTLAVFARLRSIAMVAVGLGCAAVSVAAAFSFLSHRGVWRWLALAAFVLAPVTVIIVYAFASLLWVAVVSAVGWLLAAMTARTALTSGKTDWRMPERPAAPSARRPFLIMNPRSGGGKVGKFDLKRKAEALGAEVFLMSGPGPADVAGIARHVELCVDLPAVTMPGSHPGWMTRSALEGAIMRSSQRT